MYTNKVMSDIKTNANAESPRVSDYYRKLSMEARRDFIAKSIPLSHREYEFVVVECNDDGSVYFSCAPLAVSERGAILLELEAHLKSTTDSAITVWLSPLGDRSALRKLRGVSINTTKKNTEYEGNL